MSRVILSITPSFFFWSCFGFLFSFFSPSSFRLSVSILSPAIDSMTDRPLLYILISVFFLFFSDKHWRIRVLSPLLLLLSQSPTFNRVDKLVSLDDLFFEIIPNLIIPYLHPPPCVPFVNFLRSPNTLLFHPIPFPPPSRALRYYSSVHNFFMPYHSGRPSCDKSSPKIV